MDDRNKDTRAIGRAGTDMSLLLFTMRLYRYNLQILLLLLFDIITVSTVHNNITGKCVSLQLHMPFTSQYFR